MGVRIVRLGTPRHPQEGLRIGTVRRPPRGVPKDRFSADDWYDTWLPELAPSAELVAFAMKAESEKDWSRFHRRYRSEMKAPQAAHLLDLLAALSKTTDFSVGCYCHDPTRCHRSALGALLAEYGAKILSET